MNSFIYLFIFWLCWVIFVSVQGLSPVAASGGHSSSRCVGLSPSRPLLLQSAGSRRAGSAAVAHGPSRSATCGILPDQGSNPCPLHWQADSQPLCHQGSPQNFLFKLKCFITYVALSRTKENLILLRWFVTDLALRVLFWMVVDFTSQYLQTNEATVW